MGKMNWTDEDYVVNEELIEEYLYWVKHRNPNGHEDVFLNDDNRIESNGWTEEPLDFSQTSDSIFLSAYRKHPIVLDPYIQKLYRKYKIFDHQTRTVPDFNPMWSEALKDSSTYGKKYKKKVKKWMKKHPRKLEYLKKKYALVIPKDRKNVDWIAVNSIDKKSEKRFSFDYNEVFNLSDYIPYLLYPRFQQYKKDTISYPYGYDSFEDYIKEVVDPIIEALELHIVYMSVETFDFCHANDKDSSCLMELEGSILRKVSDGYKLMGENIFGFWI